MYRDTPIQPRSGSGSASGKGNPQVLRNGLTNAAGPQAGRDLSGPVRRMAAVAWRAGLGLLLIALSSCQPMTSRPTPTPTATATATPTMTPLPTATATATATTTPTATPTATASPTATPKPSPTPLPQAWSLSPMSFEWQDWNNCGVVSLEMVLSYYGVKRGQYEIAASLKPHKDDKHVSPEELLAYAAQYGLKGGVYVNGDPERLQALVGAGIPVLIQTWLNDRPTGHYRVVRGYDRQAGTLLFNDSYYGPQVKMTLAAVEKVWAPFNHCYIPIYRPEKEATVRRILGPDWDAATMYRRAASAARQWTQDKPADPYAWFSLGDDLLGLGDAQGALEAYAKAEAIGLPEHMYWYRFGPFEALLASQQYDKLLAKSGAVLATLSAIEELHMLRGQAYEALGQNDKAIEEYQLAFTYHTNYTPAVQALQRLGGAIPPTPTITPTPQPTAAKTG